MESGLAVSQPDTTLTVVMAAPGETLAETTARCRAAVDAAEATVKRAQAALLVAQERLQRARDVEMKFRARRAGGMPAA